MSTTNNPIDKWSIIVAASLIAGAGGIMFGSFPVFLGAAADKLSLTEEQVGYLPSIFYVGYCLLSASAVFWIRKINWKAIAVAGIALNAIPLFAMSAVESYTVLLALMLLSGGGQGTIYTLATTILSDSSNPDRVFGFKLAVETIPGAAMLFILPAFVIPDWGFSGVSIVMASCICAALICAYIIPARGTRSAREVAAESTVQSHTSTPIFLPVLGLISIFLFFNAIVSPWVFLQMIGESIGLAGEDIGLILSLGLGACILGGFLAAAIGTRFGHIPPMLVITGILLGSLYLLEIADSLAVYALASIALLSILNLGISFTLGLTARVDLSGRLIVLSTAAIAGSVIVGPSISGNLISDNNFTPLLWFSAISGLLSLAIYTYVAICSHVDDAENTTEVNPDESSPACEQV